MTWQTAPPGPLWRAARTPRHSWRVTPRLSRADLAGPAERVAPSLLGVVLEARAPHPSLGSVAVRITEVEAYGGVGTDPASHAHRGPTKRNVTMFGEPGHLYVYFVYGMHWCANVVCGEPSEASAVLIRAGEVLRGTEVARERRGSPRPDHELARGPSNLAVALGITGEHDGLDLMGEGSAVRLRSGMAASPSAHAIASGPRVGIRRAVDRPWRWWIAGDPTVSRHPGIRADRPR